MKASVLGIGVLGMGLAGCASSVVGEGGVLDMSRALSGFTELEADGVNVKARVGPDWSVTVRTDRNLQPFVLTELEGDTLQIGLAAGAEYFPHRMEVVLTLPALSYAEQHGTADLLVAGLDEPFLHIVARGAGHTELEGAVDAFLLESSGSGVRNAQELQAIDAEIRTESSGAVWVRASGTVSGSLSGQGDINVFGEPKYREVEVVGQGQVVYY